MKSLFFTTAAICLAMVAFTSCRDEKTEERYMAYSTAITTDLIQSDEGGLLYVQENKSGATWVSGERLIVDYTRLSDRGTTAEKAYNVRINQAYKVLTKSLVPLSFLNTQARVDSIGSDPIDIVDLWFAGKYMNINFIIFRNNPSLKHFVNLVVNDTLSTASNLYVELRHNAYYDMTSFRTVGNASFDISGYLPQTLMPQALKVHISRRSYNGSMLTDTVTYNYNSGLVLKSPFVRGINKEIK